MLTRRQFLKSAVAAGAALSTSGYWRFANPLLAAPRLVTQAAPLPAKAIPQFIQPLPVLNAAGGTIETVIAGEDEIALEMLEFRANMLPPGFVLPNGTTYDGTWVFGYRTGDESIEPADTYTGPVIVAERGAPTQVRYINNLTADHIAWYDWTDQTLHWADPYGEMGALTHYDGPVPVVPHLHGAEMPPVTDGGPDAWFTADGNYHGFTYYTTPGVAAAGNEAVYRYINTQEAGPLWFHDHLLGGTRLNVYAGLAGAYALIDPGATLPTGLHPVGLQQGESGPVDYLIPLVIQDRMFDVNGQLYFPNVGINPEHPFWIPEFEGDTIAVNGKVWPFLNVEPRRYRFFVINGSNARGYELFLVNPVTKVMGPPIWQIATDGGYLDRPVPIDPNAPAGQLQKLVLQPGERAELIIDFAGFAGQTLVLRNTAHHPYDKGAPPNGSMLGRVMQFRVGPGPVADASYDPASLIPLRSPMVRLVDPAAGTLGAGVTVAKVRQLTLNEVMGPGGPLEILVNNTKWNGKQHLPDGTVTTRTDFTPIPVPVTEDTNYYSELPDEGTTEIWEIVNLTADVHPIHTHLTQFQLMNRQNFNTNKYNKAYAAAFPTGVFVPAYGPPFDYNTGNPRALGGNPDITAYLQGGARPPQPNEAGWKDTVQAYPGQVTRFVVRYAPLDTPLTETNPHYAFDPNALEFPYVWHCHIVDHEDNEMMRPYEVMPKSGVTRDYEQGTDY